MSHSLSRSVFTAVAASALALGCGSDQKTAESPNDIATADTAAPQPGDATMPQPNTQPPTTPPADPPPQGLNEGNSGNAVASPAVGTTAPTPLTDHQIVMIADLANTAEIEQGKLAQTKAKASSVKKFAAMMVKHHGEAKTDQAKLVKKLSLTPAESPDAMLLKSDADKILGTLRGADGAAFDVAYIDSQVDEHQKVLGKIDQQLLPSAKSEDLVSALKKMRDTVESHLKEAKSIQADLIKTAAK